MAKAVILINLKIPKVQEKLDTLYLANVFSFNYYCLAFPFKFFPNFLSTFQSHIAIVNEEESEETKASNPQQQENAEDKKKIRCFVCFIFLKRIFFNTRLIYFCENFNQ